MKIMLVGDSHGDSHFIAGVLEAARENDCELTIQLGDFGFWPGFHGERFLTEVHATMQRLEMPLWVIDGNHDWPEGYRDFVYSPVLDFCKTVQVVMRGGTHTVGGIEVGFLGGAVSIDQEWRTPGSSWWAEESLTELDVEIALLGGPVDVMLSHDAPIPPNIPLLSFGSKVNNQLDIQRRRLDTVINAWKPRLHVHGHWHMRYTCETPWGMRTGLAHEQRPNAAIAILDTETLRLH